MKPEPLMTPASSRWSQPDPDLTEWIGSQFDRALGAYAKDPKLVAEQANHEDSFRTGGYSERQLSELIQNAADAILRGGERGKIELRLTADALYCANQGAPWNLAGLDAVTHAYLSANRGEEIGRFGLGFKSALSVTDDVQVFSETVSFEFNSPDARAAIAAITPDGARLPILRTPTLIDVDAALTTDPVLAELSKWASTVIKLPNLNNRGRLLEQIEGFRTEFLLFANAVEGLRLRVDETGTDQEHRCISEGDGVFAIVAPDGAASRWLIVSEMHAPSSEAKKDVGEAIARDEVKITLAAPLDSPGDRGGFWAYFPLKDQTTARALFNAPWSVTDDRTNLLEKKFNEEILDSFTKMFARTLPRLSSTVDPSRHFDYMPSRVRENFGWGDDILTRRIPIQASLLSIVPDAVGVLRNASELRPLDFTVDVPVEFMQLWNKVPHTSPDVPHHSAYLSDTRRTRLGDLFAGGAVSTPTERAKALAAVDVRRLPTWLTDLAGSENLDYAADAIKLAAYLNRRDPRPAGIDDARIIPLQGGGRARPADRSGVFTSGELGVEGSGLRFVDPEVLTRDGVDRALAELGFSRLDPVRELEALLSKVASDPDRVDWDLVWAAVDGLPTGKAAEIVSAHVRRGHPMRVLTQAGNWREGAEVLDLAALGLHVEAESALDVRAMNSAVARAAGVVTAVDPRFPVVEEDLFAEYKAWAREDFASRSTSGGSSRILNGRFSEEYAPGPISILRVLSERDDNDALVVWSRELLKPEASRTWKMVGDGGSATEREYPAPHVWAIERFGLLTTGWGPRRPSLCLHPSLVDYVDLLPVATDSPAKRMPLIADMASVPLAIWREFFERQWKGTANDDRLTELVAAGLAALPREEPVESMPALSGAELVSTEPSAVRVARTPDELRYLQARSTPRIYTQDPELAGFLVGRLGCVPASEDVSFTVELEGRGDAEFVTDRYPVLRGIRDPRLRSLQIIRCRSVAKRITAEGGVEDEFVDAILVDAEIAVSDQLSDAEVVRCINKEMNLGLTDRDIEDLSLQIKDHQLERLREQCVKATSDAERIAMLVAPERLGKRLPHGYLEALEELGQNIDDAMLPGLFLDVYGFAALEQLKEELLERDRTTPNEWAGSPAAARFVTKFGFSPQFAGQRGQTVQRQFTVQGKPGLPPLHGYQEKILADVRGLLSTPAGKPAKGMVELPTGSGKTRVAVEAIVRSFLEGQLDGPVLWVAQSDELCEQAVRAFDDAWREFGDYRPLTIGRLWAGRDVSEPTTQLSVVVATDAMLDAGKVIIDPDYEWLSKASAVIVDEAHGAGGTRYTQILQWLQVDGRSNARPLLGLSATPFKGGGSDEGTKRLASRFGNNLFTIEGDPFEHLQSLGVLARVEHVELPGTAIELSKAEMDDAKNFSRLSGSVLNRVAGDKERTRRLVEHISSLDPEWPVLVFTASVLSAQVLAALLKTRGIAAASVSGETRRPERRRLIEQFRRGEIRVLTNCDVLTEGFDAPNVRALYVARPTLSRVAYIQMVGRGLRGPQNGGSDECMIVDLADTISNLGQDLAYREYIRIWRRGGS